MAEKWAAEFEEFGGYDHMSSAFVIRDEAGGKVAVLDTMDYPAYVKESFPRDPEMERRAKLMAAAPEMERQVGELRTVLMTMLDQIDGEDTEQRSGTG